ncbi:MAG: anhydro-N-acetylmuramic acid kinase [Deltaproteobacteria bacterium]|nr:anhydro-N-acetylmuramic acid kinase [Deltaproteobacteria bacterium]
MIGIGINTGTSADAIDVAIAEFGKGGAFPSVRLLWDGTYPYPPELKRLFLGLADRMAPLEPSVLLGMIGRLDFSLGIAFADAIEGSIKASGIGRRRISFIGSHGQTVWHGPLPSRTHPRGRFSTGSTVQLGNPSVIASRTGIPVVAHFRDKDIALGGQGAPLAPVVHFELFKHYAPAVVLNIGGIANMTVLPSRHDPSSVYGFDTGPGNRLIDIAVGAYTGGKRAFDRNGLLAGKGNIDGALLRRLMTDPFVRRHPPKSTGRERYNRTYLTSRGIAMDDLSIIATLTAFTAYSIAYNIGHFVGHRTGHVIICGGGANNRTLIRHLSRLVPDADTRPVEDLGYRPGAVEPLLFAYLGYLGFNRVPVRLKGITGSTSAFVPGGIYYPLVRT